VLNRPFFKKSETLSRPSPEHQKEYLSHFDHEFHGTDGPIKTVHSKEYAESHKYWHETLNNLDLKTNISHFSGSNVGVWTTLTSVEPDSRKRSYSATAYYLPSASRKNLIPLTNAVAREVVLEQEEGEWVAKGVRFTRQGDEFFVRVSREVILSTGSVQSPQLLELSGIGNHSILNNAGIAVKVENANVGENLQDHMSELYQPNQRCRMDLHLTQ
jgi:choline dehydrogenase-like flavoprotein